MHNATLIFKAKCLYFIAIKEKAFKDDVFAGKQGKFYGAVMRDATSDEIDLIDLIQTLWDRKWLITAITVAFAILSVGVMFQIPPSFDGRMKLGRSIETKFTGFAPLNDTGHSQ